MRVYRDLVDGQGNVTTIAVFDIMEATYTGQDMGKRVITATIKYPTPINFHLGDYVVLSMQSLYRNGNHGSVEDEKFYIYTEPQCKKTARPMSAGDAFETTVNFYPRQYELSCIQMRDFIQQGANNAKIIYTGFDTVSFYGGAHELLERCMACMAQHYKDPVTGDPLWTYELDPSLNEVENNALERYAFSFSGNSVMDALQKLNDKDFINTTFYINGRTIHVGKKRPFLCSVNVEGAITDNPLRMMYGKTSHEAIDIDHGGLYDITKTVGEEVPITKLFAYGAARNLNRYYCSDRIQSGRFVNKLMLPAFSDDGETDYIISEDGVQKYGVREGSKTFDEIYPSLRYMTYADIRGIRYCIKVKASGLDADQFDSEGHLQHTNSGSTYPLARVQCYKVTPCTGDKVGRNELVECAPPEDLVIFIHATGKTVKVVLYGGATNAEALQKQMEHDPKVPTRTAGGTDYIPGSCFCVHDVNFKDMNGAQYDDTTRRSWFTQEFRRYSDTDSLYAETPEQQVAELHRIEYVDTFWLTDLYVMEYENGEALYDDQRNFPRDGYSAWAWPRLNNESVYPDTLPVNEVVAVEPIVIADTSDNINAGRQQHWDIYLRDLGFAIDEQNDFGEMVFVFATPVVSVLDGILEGREFTIDGGENLNNFQERVVCAYNEDGSFNHDFLFPGDSGNAGIPQQALMNGAVWRIRLNRNDNDSELSSVGLVIPNTDIQMQAGAHIVLLDIYMPDIYIRAAEQRLKREAIWYLEKNDKGNIKYAISFDKVRFNQIKNYALQMREGLTLRVEDEDLRIQADNVERTIVSHDVPNSTDVPMYIDTYTEHFNVPKETTYTFYANNSDGQPKFAKNVTTENLFNGWIRVSFSLMKSDGIAVFDENLKIDVWRPGQNLFRYENFEWHDMIDRYSFSFDVRQSPRPETPYEGYLDVDNCTMNVALHELISYTTADKEYQDEGTRVPAICRDYVRFKAGKYYEVTVDLQIDDTVDPAYWHADDDAIVLTVAPTSDETRYSIQGYSKEFIRAMREDGKWFRRYKYSFFLPDSFTEREGYYVSFYYYTPANSGTDKIDFAAVRMVSIIEKDLDVEGQVANYVDFLVSSVTIKIQDNTRPDDTRIMGVRPESIIDISAQIEEQTKASTWGTLMNSVEKTRIEGEQNKRTYEMLANTARLNYQSLLNLKNNIFDPDGTCNDLFLQVMMLQVGADSMNYQLDYTFTTPTGVQNNFSVSGRDVQQGTYDVFRVVENDKLHHFVYTQGAGNAGTWQIPGNFEFPLSPEIVEGNTVWPTYYVCIRCRRDSANDLNEPAWICSTKQYAVNDPDDTSYWYFNWGILTADSSGHYSLMETRGNAYMYGDNIIAGKISTIAGNSYFDLTHGNFVLAQDPNSPSLSYINGKLTISGVTDSVIGGENLLYVTEHDMEYEFEWDAQAPVYTELTYYSDQTSTRQHTLLPAGDYVFSADGIEYDTQASGWDKVLTLCAFNASGSMSKYEVLHEGNIRNLIFSLTEPCYICLGFLANTQTSEQPSQAFARAHKMMLQRGTRSTEFNPFTQLLANAMQGSTEITGGLVMTNVMLLKDEQGNVTAGMSGLKDDSTEQGEESYGVTLFSGGTYEQALAQAQAAAQGTISQLQTLLPILLTKSGPGSRLGCFNIDSENQVSIIGADNTSKIVFNTGDISNGAYVSIIKNGSEVIRITTDSIEPEKNIFMMDRYHYTNGNTIVNVDEDTTGKVVEIDSKSFVSKDTFYVRKNNASYLLVDMYLAYGGLSSQKINISLDVYLADKKIGTIQNAPGTYVHTDTLVHGYISLPNYDNPLYGNWSYDPAHTGDVKLEIRNISISDDDRPNRHPAITIRDIAVGTYDGSDWDTWADGELRLYTDEITPKTVIGKNGLSVNGSRGTNFSFLSTTSGLKFNAFGLQRDSGASGQITQIYRDWSKFRKEIDLAASMWNSWTSSDRAQFWSDLRDAIPENISPLMIN